MKIMVCDSCGQKSDLIEQNCSPKDWQELSFQIKYSMTKRYQLCPLCCKRLDIKPDNTDGRNESIADRLLDIIEEIAGNVVEERTGV